MTMYKCLFCGAEFEKPHPVPDGEFMFNLMVHLTCPECGEDEFEEMEDDDDR